MAVACCSLAAVATQTIYLDANDIWDKDDAKLIVHSWGSADNDAELTLVSGHIFKAEIPDGQTGLLFKRLSPSCTDYSTWCNREGYWGKTLDQTITSGKDLCKITGWEEKEEPDWCGDKSEATVGVAKCEWGTYGSGTTPSTGDVTVEGLYLIGEWNDKNYGDGADYANFIEENKFVDCKISKTFVDEDPERSACWIRAKAKIKKADGETGWMFFSTDDWQGDGNQTITLYSADYLYKIGHDEKSNRWSVPTNKKLNITLTIVSVDEIKLSLVDDAAFAGWTCSEAGIGNLTEIENVEPKINATLDLNAPMYDILGRQVNAQYKGIVIQNGQKYIR